SGIIAVVSLFLATGIATADSHTTPTVAVTTSELIGGNVDWCAGDPGGGKKTTLTGTNIGYYPPDEEHTGTDATITVGETDGTVTITVTVKAGATASGIVVKAGPEYFLYEGPFVGPVVVTGL